MEDEEEIQIKLIEEPLKKLGFQMQLGNPWHTTSSSISTHLVAFTIEGIPFSFKLCK